jgi:adenylate cyclase
MLALRGWDPAFMAAQRASGFDALQRLWPRPANHDVPVRVIDIDEKSIARLGQWPWPRDKLAVLVRELADMGAAAIAFDIVFPEEDRMSPRRILQNPQYAPLLKQAEASILPDFDQEFAAAMAGKPVVLAFARGDTADAAALPSKAGFAQTGAAIDNATPRLGRVTANLPQLQAAAAGLGSINIDLAAQQGVTREVPMLWSDGQRLLPSLAAEALRVAQGADTFLVHADAEQEDAVTGMSVGEVEMPLNETGAFQLYFRPEAPDLYVSAADVIFGGQQETLRPRIEGTIVLVGTSAVGLLDARTTPLGDTVPGVSVHAQALEQMLSGQHITRPEWLAGFEIAGAGLLSLFTVLGAALARPVFSSLIVAGLVATIALAVAVAFRQFGFLLDATFPIVMVLSAFLGTIAYRLLVTDRLGRQLRHMFGHYVSPAVLSELERNPGSLKLGGEIRTVTVMFLDIAEFTPLSEKIRADELVAVVNGLWDVCSKAILAEQGTIDKFIGDAIMAFWNAPVLCADHQYRACRAALGVRKAVQTYNEDATLQRLLRAKGLRPLRVRIGIATGEACVGNMGSSDRFDYSAIGETVNAASRAEGVCKHVHHDIVLAGPVDTATQRLAILPAGYVRLKGISLPQPVTIIVGDEELAAKPDFQALAVEHNSLTAKLASGRQGHKNVPVIAQILAEMSVRSPSLSDYLGAIVGRARDFRSDPARP